MIPRNKNIYTCFIKEIIFWDLFYDFNKNNKDEREGAVSLVE